MDGSRDLSVPHREGRWIGDVEAFHSEGGFWDQRAGVLRYVDMLRGDIITWNGSQSERQRLGKIAAVVRARRQGGYIAAEERGFVLLDDDLGVERRIPVFDDPAVRMNEGACDAAGRFYCGTMPYDYRRGGGSLYRLDPDLSVHVALESVTIPNGLVWADGGAVALHADTADDAIYAYEFDVSTGAFGDRETFIDFSGTAGSPDGMALDAEGGLWVAMWGGSAVHRYDAQGALSDVLPLPVMNVTSCTIGGSSGTTLFATTSKQGRGDAAEAQAGKVYAVDVGVGAAAVHAFG